MHKESRGVVKRKEIIRNTDNSPTDKNKGTRGSRSRVPMLKKGGDTLQVSVERKPNAAQLGKSLASGGAPL
jgi:hypothetical protein